MVALTRELPLYCTQRQRSHSREVTSRYDDVTVPLSPVDDSPWPATADVLQANWLTLVYSSVSE
ncbi:hypothetical protein J6590_031015 [Homalodisca vitripennis]|nr:hypothetical protein J6590_031015 [Homalodisca vitripennis]